MRATAIKYYYNNNNLEHVILFLINLLSEMCDISLLIVSYFHV